MQEKTHTLWYKTLIDNINHICSQFSLSDSQTNFLRDFILRTAKDQFKSGSKSGAGWAFKQAREKTVQEATK